MTLRREQREMKRATLKTEREYEAAPCLIDLIVARDGVAHVWAGEGNILAVEDSNVGVWEMIGRLSPWTFEYKGWSARLKRHLWQRTGDKLDALYDLDKEIQEVRYEGQLPPQGEQP